MSYLKGKHNFEKFLFVELFIFFYDYISYDEKEKDYLLDRQTFIGVNSSLFSIVRKETSSSLSEEEFEKKILKDIYQYLKGTKKYVNLDKLIFYLKHLSSLELTEENLFKIIDKTDKGYIVSQDVLELLTGIQQFLASFEDLSYPNQYFNNKNFEIINNIFKQSTLEPVNLRNICKANKEIFKSINSYFEHANDIIVKLLDSIKRKSSEVIIGGFSDVLNFQNEENEKENNKDTSGTLLFGINDTIGGGNKIFSDEKIILITDEINRGNFDMITNESYNKFRSLEEKTINQSNSQMIPRASSISNKKKLPRKLKDANEIETESIELSLKKNRKLPLNHEMIILKNITVKSTSTKDLLKIDNQSNTNLLKFSTINNTRRNSDLLNPNTSNFKLEDNKQKTSDILNKNPILYKDLIDVKKINRLEKLRIQSCIYDISVNDFILEIINMKHLNIFNPNQLIQRKNYIEIILKIINTYTYQFNEYSKRSALNDIFNLLVDDTEKAEFVSVEHMIGLMIVLCKGTVTEKLIELINYISIYERLTKSQLVALFSGIVELLLKYNVNDTHFFSYLNSNIIGEAIYQDLMNESLRTNHYIVNNEKLIEWIGLNTYKNINDNNYNTNLIKDYEMLNKNEFYSINKNPNSLEAREDLSPVFILDKYTKQDLAEVDIYEIIMEIIQKNKKMLKLELFNLNIAIEIFKKNSLLGQLNKFQLIMSFKEIFDFLFNNYKITFTETEKNEKISLIFKILNLDFKNCEIYDLAEILIPLIILFEGTPEEKLFAIFTVFKNSNESDLNDINFRVEELELLFIYFFKFILNQIKQNQVFLDVNSLTNKISNSLTEDIFEYFHLNHREGATIKFKQITEYYYHIC